MSKINLNEIFPFIKEAIQSINLTERYADRDSIVSKLLTYPDFMTIIRNAETPEKFDDIWRVGNAVDWFSAHYTRKSEISLNYLQEFEREKISVKNKAGRNRKVWAYSVVSSKITEEIEPAKINEFYEGAVRKVLVNKYERDTNARLVCINHFGYNCQVCDMNFESVYGELGLGFIHVHHIVPISSIGEKYVLNPIEDLIPVCPNCHAMLHKKPEPSVEELREIVKK
jgi:predicted HNH restriction endonuclease